MKKKRNQMDSEKIQLNRNTLEKKKNNQPNEEKKRRAENDGKNILAFHGTPKIVVGLHNNKLILLLLSLKCLNF